MSESDCNDWPVCLASYRLALRLGQAAHCSDHENLAAMVVWGYYSGAHNLMKRRNIAHCGQQPSLSWRVTNSRWCTLTHDADKPLRRDAVCNGADEQ